MPICKKCNDHFPNISTIDNKEIYLHRRSYCLKCSPLGAKNGYVIRKEFTAQKAIAKNEEICVCCKNRNSSPKNKVCSTCRSWYARYTRKHKAIDLLGGECVLCGCCDKDCLSFHHIDPSSKDFGLSENWGTKKWEVVKKELEKCELLCHNCHAKKHLTERKESHKLILEYYKYGTVDQRQSHDT